MPEITKKELEHLARLSRITLTDAELKKMVKDLDAIVGYVKELEITETAGVEPFIGATSAKNILRADEVEHDVHAAAQTTANRIRNAFPASEKGHLKVPKIL